MIFIGYLIPNIGVLGYSVLGFHDIYWIFDTQYWCFRISNDIYWIFDTQYWGFQISNVKKGVSTPYPRLHYFINPNVNLRKRDRVGLAKSFLLGNIVELGSETGADLHSLCMLEQ